MSNTPSNYRWVQTEDGSLTLYSEQFQEACHSPSGARTETLLHYLGGCKVLERVGEHAPFIILEVGFGLGVGFEVTRDALKDQEASWHFISLELDRKLVEWWGEKNPGFTWVAEDIAELKSDNSTLTILVGDARRSLPKYMQGKELKFHAIYQDAFSPHKTPSLWAKEWFTFLKECSAPDVLLSTYSASNSIRKSLVEAGWKLKPGEKFGSKRSSTRASLTGESDEEILLNLSRSPVPAITDEN